MNVLVCGAGGFIGAAVVGVLLRRRHRVVGTARRGIPTRPNLTALIVDFNRDIDVAVWIPRLQQIDVVVNAVGIFRGSPQEHEDVHSRAPEALFAACRRAGVKRIVQVSALGSEAGAATAFQRTKFAADEALSAVGISFAIVQPSLVVGPGGASTRFFTALASLPIIPLPGSGAQQVQPVAIDDVAEAIAILCESQAVEGRVAAVGPEPLTLKQWMTNIRTRLGLGAPRFLHVPMWLTGLAARWGQLTGRGLLDRDSLIMLTRGNTADPAAFTSLLGRPPNPAVTRLGDGDQSTLRTAAVINWIAPLLQVSIALVWIWTGIVSLGLYPIDESRALLEQSGVPNSLTMQVLYVAAALDIMLGVLTLMVRRRWVYGLQIATIAIYTAIISWALPEFWIHPYGPMIKNLPMVGVLLLLYCLERPGD